MTLALLFPGVQVILTASIISRDSTGTCSACYFKVNKQRVFWASHSFGKLSFLVLQLSWGAQSRAHPFPLHREQNGHLIPPPEGELQWHTHPRTLSWLGTHVLSYLKGLGWAAAITKQAGEAQDSTHLSFPNYPGLMVYQLQNLKGRIKRRKKRKIHQFRCCTITQNIWYHINTVNISTHKASILLVNSSI